MLKGIIFASKGVFFPRKNSQHPKRNQELIKLLAFLKGKGVQPVFLLNQELWSPTGQKFHDLLVQQVGEIPWFCSDSDASIPRKPRKAAVAHVLEAMDWKPHEVAYVGSVENDMRTAVNGGVLFLSACWYGVETEYGISMEEPKDIARFVDLFGVREYEWFWKIEQGALRAYALGPFSTFIEKWAPYSGDARSAAKFEGGNINFWKKLLWSALYFSGIYEEVDFITIYPRHDQNARIGMVATEMAAFAKCFRKKFYPDAIVRHQKALKSAKARSSGDRSALSHKAQLETIHLNEYPLKGIDQEPYKQRPYKRGQTALVIDDFCTRGYSLEAARAYFEAAGCKVILLPWLKTINSDYCAISGGLKLEPFRPNSVTSTVRNVTYNYGDCVVGESAAQSLVDLFNSYKSWTW